jgi:hypothetical protein
VTTISKEAKLVIFINIFTVEPANQQRLVQLPARVAQMSVRHARGFISSALHRSLADSPNVRVRGCPRPLRRARLAPFRSVCPASSANCATARGRQATWDAGTVRV